jgi:nitrile hydratase
MNGVHDMGGMHGMGPVEYENNEPVFHARWEARTFALNCLMRAWKRWNLDRSRHGIERIPPAEYLRMSYYEKWFTGLVGLLLESGLVSRAEIESGAPRAEAAKATPPTTAEQAVATLSRAGSPRRDASVAPQFHRGQPVRARNLNPPGHTRLPRYARGKLGTVDRDHGVFVFPDTHAHFLGEKPQHVYSVRFAARELWGESASPRDSVYVDLWDDYLEPA